MLLLVDRLLPHQEPLWYQLLRHQHSYLIQLQFQLDMWYYQHQCIDVKIHSNNQQHHIIQTMENSWLYEKDEFVDSNLK